MHSRHDTTAVVTVGGFQLQEQQPNDQGRQPNNQ